MREMKDSGVEWIGEIPETWIVERLQWHLDEIKESNSPIKTTQVLSLTNKAGVIPYEDKGEQGNKAKENYDEYKLAYPDTIVANSMNILIGSVGICRYFGCVSPVYYVFKPKENELLSYLNYVFQMEQFQKELRRYANGILEIRLRLSSANIIKRYVAFPSHEEQIAISHFLDRKCTQIDALISNAQQQIEKLKAYKQSVITETVTKGLDPDVQMKDSGVEWIGEIPEHWDVAPIMRVAKLYNGDRSSNYPSGLDIVDEGILFVTSNNLDGIELNANISTNKYITAEKYNSLRGAKLEINDIVFCLRGSVGKCGINYTFTSGTIASSLVCIRAQSISPSYLNFMLHTFAVIEQAKLEAIGIGSQNLAAEDIGRVIIPIPNEIEQQQISAYLDRKCSQIEKLIALKQQKIEKLQQYKKSLIYEYVTGKKEV